METFRRLARGKVMYIDTTEEIRKAGAVQITMKPISDKKVLKTKVRPYKLDSRHGKRLLLIHGLKKKGKTKEDILREVQDEFYISESTAGWYMKLYRLRHRPAKRKWLTDELFRELEK